MLARIFGRQLGIVVAGAGLLIVWASSGLGQTQLGNESLKKDYEAIGTKARQDLISGATQPGKNDDKIMDVMAKWHVLRVTWTLQRDNPSEMAKVHENLDGLVKSLLNPTAAKANGPFKDQLGKHLAKSLRDVLALDFADNRLAVVNAALMLPAVAKLKQEEVGDLFVELLKDQNRHDAVKMYAAKAMREFFPAHMVDINDNPADAKVQKKLKRDMDRLQALAEFIDRKGPAPADEGEREVIRYLRREGVISLAQVGVPALRALKQKEVQGPAAYELLRVLVKGKGALEPRTSLAERVEAALGVCQLKDTAGDRDYDPSVAVYAVGLCFFDYASEYKADHINIFNVFKTKEAPKDGIKIPTVAWKIQSERFKQAVNDLAAGSKGTPASANAQQLAGEIGRMADTIIAYKQLQDDLGAFRKRVEAMAPKTGKLYKMNGPQIDPQSLQGGAAEEN